MTTEVRWALLPGDGVGPQVMASARAALEVVASSEALRFAFDEIPCGGRYYLEHGHDWPLDAETRCDSADALLLGAVGFPDPKGTGPVTFPDGRMAGWSAVLGNRARLDLYANVRPVRLFEGVQHRISGRRDRVWAPEAVDLVILRENTEGLYVGAGGVLRRRGIAEVATDTRILTRRGCERICALALEMARGRPERKVTAVAKHNVLDGCRFFVEVFQEVAERYPDVDTEVVLVDAFAQSLLTEPERYEVVVTTNLFGDILTDLAAVLQGGMGLAVGSNVGETHGMFEPIHGSALDLARRNAANPMAMMLAAAEALRWLSARRNASELGRAADRIENAIREVLLAGAPLSEDLATPGVTTQAVTEAILARI